MNPNFEFKEAEEFFSQIYFGKHHIPGKIKPFGPGWCINHLGELATFDFSQLTRLVFLAHDACIRVSIMNSGPQMVKIALHKRNSREGSMCERHPAIEQALTKWRKYYDEREQNGR